MVSITTISQLGCAQDLLYEACHQLRERGVRQGSRNGAVIRLPGPAVIAYQQPMHMVVTDRDRDANPFFHLFEAMWMLSGSDSVAWPSFFAKQLAAYSDDGKTFNAAYGHRWRVAAGMDQLAKVAERLYINPNCRRQVVTIWLPRDLDNQNTKDLPCNTQVMFEVTDGRLNMTVVNRSNDAIWGCFGANVVHFSMLLVYMAHLSRHYVGSYVHFTNNLHVYEHHFPLMEKLADKAADVMSGSAGTAEYRNETTREPMLSFTLDQWDQFFSCTDWSSLRETIFGFSDHNQIAWFLTKRVTSSVGGVLQLLLRTWFLHKASGPVAALKLLDDELGGSQIDWVSACHSWLQRRVK